MPASARPYGEIVDALLSPYAGDDLVADAAVPLLVTDVTGHTIDHERAEVLSALPVVTVAVADDARSTRGAGLAAFDVLLSHNPAGDGQRDVDAVRWITPGDGAGATVDGLTRRARANPQACVAAVQLLRLSAGLGVTNALVAESLTYSTLQAGPESRGWLNSRAAPSDVDVNPAPLIVERSGSELRIEFDRPEIRNAFGFEVRDALVEALQLAAADSSIESVVITGRGPSFCSGGDLREFGTLSDPASAHLIRTTRSAGYWIHRLARRVRFEIHGACIGAGIELPAFAGQVTAAPDTFVSLPEVAMGLVPGAGGTVSLPRRIGRHRTAYLALTGERLPAETALAWGLVDDLA